MQLASSTRAASPSSDAGWITGITPMLTNMGAGEADLVFNWPAGLDLTQNTFLTNKPAATAMRAPGTMKSALFAGAVVDHVAKTVGKEVEEIKELNFYQVGDKSCVNDVVFGAVSTTFCNSGRRSSSPRSSRTGRWPWLRTTRQTSGRRRVLRLLPRS